MSEFDVNRRVW